MGLEALDPVALWVGLGADRSGGDMATQVHSDKYCSADISASNLLTAVVMIKPMRSAFSMGGRIQSPRFLRISTHLRGEID